MKKIFILFVVLMFSLTSCELEYIDNGELDGNWNMVSIETLATEKQDDVSGLRRFWAIQAKLLQLSGGGDSYYFRFKHQGDSLWISEPYKYMEHQTGGDSLLTKVPVDFANYGIYHLEEHYKVEKLSGGKMILKSDSIRLYFRRF